MTKLLNIQDKNITIEENSIEIKQGKMSIFITAKFMSTPTHYVCCGIANEDYTVYKNGTMPSHIILPISGVYSTYKT